uniref:Competence protein ComEA n=1 Tax=Candidatus Kentrum sp. TC TaxID=2126339 RepID=A0A450ZCE3_9GAMM|nr:MAG: competence protein ComEA [Candidatus Kentron sp. TC]VFK51464.1 MAG: competence protein ComEA [Candidatus Kentron sp. TC]
MKTIKRVLFAFLLVTPGLAASGPVDINTATEDELIAIKGIGPVIARRVVAERSAGIFCSLREFAARVKGIGARIIEVEHDNLTVGDVEEQCAKKP